ncbi:hypothetical protein NMG60_11000755 [Bertholletia excelsa]
MQGLAEGGVRLELRPGAAATPLTIDGGETPDTRIRRLVSENSVVIFSRPACYMCHVMKRLLSNVGVCPSVIELDEDELPALTGVSGGGAAVPALFIGGDRVGGLESLVALHLSGHLVPKLVEVGALKEW